MLSFPRQSLSVLRALLVLGPAFACGAGSPSDDTVVTPPPPQPPPPPSQSAPAKRAHHAIVYDEANERILVTGGSSPHASGACCTMFNDLWSFDGTRWTALPSSGAPISGMRLAYDSRNQRVVSFGGWNNGISFPDLRVLQDNAWVALSPLTQMPAAETGFVFDSRRNRFVAFGGFPGHDQVNSDTWEFDGTAWTRVATSGPAPRMLHAMVFDERRGVTVLFGGVTPSPPAATPQIHGDVWEFDGTRWQQVPTPGGPSPRMGAGATWDSQRNVAIVFGGSDASATFGDLWAWSGAAWSKLADASSNGPEPRDMGYIAYDKRRDRIVLFGGRKGWPIDLDDTWEWDGERWSRVP